MAQLRRVWSGRAEDAEHVFGVLARSAEDPRAALADALRRSSAARPTAQPPGRDHGRRALDRPGAVGDGLPDHRHDEAHAAARQDGRRTDGVRGRCHRRSIPHHRSARGPRSDRADPAGGAGRRADPHARSPPWGSRLRWSVRSRRMCAWERSTDWRRQSCCSRWRCSSRSNSSKVPGGSPSHPRKDVARGLPQPLALDHPLPLVGEPRPAGEPLE
jgi:hypothetical protein